MRNETASAQACYELRGGRLYVNGERQAVVPATVKTALFLYEAGTGIRFECGDDGPTRISEDLGRFVIRMERLSAIRQMASALASAA